MDRQSIIGFVLIAAVFIIWMIWSASNAPNPAKILPSSEQTVADSTVEDIGSTQRIPDSRSREQQTEMNRQPGSETRSAETTDTPDSLSTDENFYRYGKWFKDLAGGRDITFTVETEKYVAEFTSRGGSIKRFTLNDYKTWNQAPLQLIDWQLASDFNILFGTSDGRLIETDKMNFRFSKYPKGGSIVIPDSGSYSFEAILPIRGDSIAIVKKYTVLGGTFNVDVDIEMRNMSEVIANYEYQFILQSPALTERNSVDESTFSEAMAYIDSEVQTLDGDDREEAQKLNIDGGTSFVAVHNKYFISAVITRDGFEGAGAYLEGITIPLKDKGQREMYQAGLKIKYLGAARETVPLRIFIGPMEYDLLKDQHTGLETAISLGIAWIVKPFSEYMIIPLFNFLHGFIPNYGFVIILFSIIIKLLLYPLTKKSMLSMQKMQKLQPVITEMKEKHKDDQQKQNTEMMKLYKEYGVNPAGGCLPLVLQMPILFALFTIFRSTIDLRQQNFIWWITDLAAPDILLDLPFTIPIVEMSFISGLALVMSLTMFIQQKMTVQDPRQKSMVYMMPLIFWFMFNGFPAGLNLYYFMFNLLSIIQQQMINRKHKDEPLEKVVKKPGSGKSWSDRAMASMQNKVEQQKKGPRK